MKILFISSLLLTVTATAQLSETAAWAATTPERYWVTPNVIYAVSNGFECKLDVYRPANAVSPVPTVVFIHGGGWVVGSKESAILQILPYLEMGVAVVNVEYRLARVSLAPAAVEDCRRALRWVFANAKTYAFDTTRVVVTGGSAGGHLALMTGMLDGSAGFDQTTGWDPVPVVPRVAAIINWFGITDVADLLEGPNYQQYAAAWLGSLPNRKELAAAMSPLTYAGKMVPPILTIHGTNDQLVPYEHAVKFHEKLRKNKRTEELITITGGRHGGFTREQMLSIYGSIRAFLHRCGIMPS